MGFWNDGVRSRSRSRSRSPSRRKRSSSHGGVYSRPTAARSASSFLESVTGYSTASKAATPRRGESYTSHSASRDRGLFGFGSSSNRGYGHSSSHRGARSRDGFVAKVRSWLRKLYHYMKKNPMKVFFLVIMPLITGGALTKILSTVGIRLPPQLQRMVGSNMNRGFSQSERYYSRGGARDFGGGSNLPGMSSGGLGGLGDSAAGLMKMAKMFM